jgi:CIC family chloride channel protein
LTLELTNAYPLSLPLLATCLAANFTAYLLGGRPIHEKLLDRILRLAGSAPTPKNAAAG